MADLAARQRYIIAEELAIDDYLTFGQVALASANCRAPSAICYHRLREDPFPESWHLR